LISLGDLENLQIVLFAQSFFSQRILKFGLRLLLNLLTLFRACGVLRARFIGLADFLHLHIDFGERSELLFVWLDLLLGHVLRDALLRSHTR
jgi:hypothetical protein